MPRNIIVGQKIYAPLLEAARKLRAGQTLEEQILWDCLRERRLNGWKFRRQQIIGAFIVDFYCHAGGLVIELDGDYHNEPEQKADDDRRDVLLQERGLRILRVPNNRIRCNLEAVLAEITLACSSVGENVNKDDA